MLITIDAGANQPLFEQIATAVRTHIATGEVEGGQRLPAAKELAEQLDVNLHTVLKAYQTLRDEGLVDLRRGRGAVISQDAARLNRLAQPADALLQAAANEDLGIEAVVALLRTRASGK